MRFEVFDRFDNYLFALGSADLEEAKWYSCLDGQDMLTVSTGVNLEKGWRLVWRDRRGKYHEHVVDSSSGYEDETEQYICLNSITDLYGTYIDHIRPNGGAASAISYVLTDTVWQLGRCDVQGVHEIVVYHTSVREALTKIQENWGGELEAEIRVSGDQIIERRVNLMERLGADNGKRFVYTKDLENVSRTIQSDDPITRLYGFGRGEESGDGYGPRIDFSSVNGGKKYIEDVEATQIWGHPDGKGGKAPHDGIVIFESCEDPEELLELTKAAFPALKEPKVSYSASVVDLEAMGFTHEGVDVGDTVTVIDMDHQPQIRVEARVTDMTEDLLSGDKELTLGNYIDDAGDMIASSKSGLGSIEQKASNWDAAASNRPGYLQQLIDSLNNEFNQAGSYLHLSFETGITVSDVPLDEHAKPTKTPASGINITGRGFRIADDTTSDGDFDWRVFGTGKGFTAEEIVAGTLRCGDNWMNLDTGEVWFENAHISGNSVYIGAVDVETWAESKIQMLKDSIKITVQGGSLGGSASITVELDGQKQVAEINMKDVRKAFANDDTAVTIQAGTVAFASNTFIVNSTYFSVEANGTITATAGHIGGFTITATEIYNGMMSLSESGLGFKTTTGQFFGSIGRSSWYEAPNYEGLHIELQYASRAYYVAIGGQQNSTDPYWTIGFMYAARAFSAGGYSYRAHSIHYFAHVYHNNYGIYNAVIDLNTCWFNSNQGIGVTTYTGSYCLPTSISSDGLVTNYQPSCSLRFSNGICIEVNM